MLLQDFVVLHFMDIDQTPSRKWAGASSCYLKTGYADDSVLDTVVVGFCNSLFAFILNGSKRCFRRLQPVLIVSLRKIWLVMGATRFVAHRRTLRNYPR